MEYGAQETRERLASENAFYRKLRADHARVIVSDNRRSRTQNLIAIAFDWPLWRGSLI
jgi:hypothetical protein